MEVRDDPPTTNIMDYAKALRISRAIAGLQQKDLAEKAGLHSSYLSLLEQGKRKPSLKVVRDLSEALKIPTHLFTLLASEEEDLSLVEPSELQQAAESLARVLFPTPLREHEPKRNKPAKA